MTRWVASWNSQVWGHSTNHDDRFIWRYNQHNHATKNNVIWSITFTYHFRLTIKIISQAVNVKFFHTKQKIPDCGQYSQLYKKHKNFKLGQSRTSHIYCHIHKTKLRIQELDIANCPVWSDTAYSWHITKLPCMSSRNVHNASLFQFLNSTRWLACENQINELHSSPNHKNYTY
jgi:hypothetical protein